MTELENQDELTNKAFEELEQTQAENRSKMNGLMNISERLVFNLNKSIASANRILNKALDDKALIESMDVELEKLANDLEDKETKLFGVPETEEELEPIQDLDPSHPDYQPPIA